MIYSAEEFKKLRESNDPTKYVRAAHEEASFDVWMDIINKYPELKEWVAHNKTIPIEILNLLSSDLNHGVRHMVASKRKIPEEIQLRLASDTDDPYDLLLYVMQK